MAVPRGKVKGRGAEIVALVEHSEFAVGRGEAVGVPQTRCSDGRSVRTLAVPANVDPLSLSYGHIVSDGC